MNDDLLKKYLGYNCVVSAKKTTDCVRGKLMDFDENWIEIEVSSIKQESCLIKRENIKSLTIIKNPKYLF